MQRRPIEKLRLVLEPLATSRERPCEQVVVVLEKGLVEELIAFGGCHLRVRQHGREEPFEHVDPASVLSVCESRGAQQLAR